MTSVRKRSFDYPADIDVATKVLILYDDVSAAAGDVYVRQSDEATIDRDGPSVARPRSAWRSRWLVARRRSPRRGTETVVTEQHPVRRAVASPSTPADHAHVAYIGFGDAPGIYFATDASGALGRPTRLTTRDG